MKASQLFSLTFVLILLATLTGAAGSTALAGPCVPGAAYDPACDADHDGDVDIFDIQLTAGHWSQSGTYVGDNNHNHLGQTWTGNNNPLKFTGAYGAPDYAALVLSNSSGKGLQVNSAEFDGVSVGTAGVYGVFVFYAGEDGVSVNSAGRAGVSVNWAIDDGVLIRSAGDDGIQLGEDGSNPDYGLFVPAPGTSSTTLWPNTADAAGQWALYTVDNIEAGNVLLGSQSLLALVGGNDDLTPGDVVAVAGLADPLPGSQPRLPQVRLATAELGNVVGVVTGRMALQPAEGKEGVEILLSAEGPAQPGDYVAITVLGVAQVKVDEGIPIGTGQRLTAGDTPGQTRAIRTVKVQLADGAGAVDMLEPVPVIGVTLGPVVDGLVWVLVNPQ